jgi:hypothetical protein
MNIVIEWRGYDLNISSCKHWYFTDDDFNNEIPPVGDLINLVLPIPYSTINPNSKIQSNTTDWEFKVIKRSWKPEAGNKEKSVKLTVELDNIKRFLELSKEAKDTLTKTLDEQLQNDRIERRRSIMEG